MTPSHIISAYRALVISAIARVIPLPLDVLVVIGFHDRPGNNGQSPWLRCRPMRA
ncbi:hypothetical protein ACVBEG_27120 [Pseudomonas sp. GG8]